MAQTTLINDIYGVVGSQGEITDLNVDGKNIGLVRAVTGPGGGIRISDPTIEQEIIRLGGAEPYEHYFCHCFAGNHWSGDKKLYDLASGNHFTPGANLPIATLWGAQGVATTLKPATGALDSVLKAPAINFDYLAGEKLIFWWYGVATPEASDVSLLGDGNSTSFPGWRVRIKSTGKFDVGLHASSGNHYSAASPGVVFDGSPHTLAFAINGATRTYGMWSDEAFYSPFGAQYANFSGQAAIDTKTSGVLNIGRARPTDGVDGAATATRALVVLRLPSSANMPQPAALTALFQSLRAAPQKLLRKGAM